MKNICVITGGGSGMGLETARLMGKDHMVIIAGRTIEKLQSAVDKLRAENIEVEGYACDVSNKDSVLELANFAASKGRIKTVIHSAGVSPNQSSTEQILNINAMGTIYVNDVFINCMEKGGCLINVASMAGHMIPGFLLPIGAYRLARTNQQLFKKKLKRRLWFAPPKHRSGIAYGISKNFVTWYTKTSVKSFADKDLRIVSVSPGFFETPMGEAEKDGSELFLERSAIKRYGKVEEIAQLFRYISSEKLGYLTGVDILCDGGCIASTMVK